MKSPYCECSTSVGTRGSVSHKTWPVGQGREEDLTEFDRF